jgi:hypothetical protein
MGRTGTRVAAIGELGERNADLGGNRSRLATLLPARGSGPEETKGRIEMIRKLKSGGYRLYSRKVNPKTGRRRNLGTFHTRQEAEKHERAVQFFKRHH